MTENMTNPIDEELTRIAYRGCGAQSAGDRVGRLFDAAPAHLADHHRELRGALELETVRQMSVEVPGAD
jgi:hypothetical protein